MASDTESSIDQDATIVAFPTRATRTTVTEPTTTVPTPLIRDAIGEVLREERHRQRRTLHDVADHAFVSVAHLSEVERGLKEGSSEVIESITRALGIEVAEVLDRSADRLRLGMRRNDTTLAIAA